MEMLSGQGMSSQYHQKRRFPGPAGLLPDLDDERIMNLNSLKYSASQMVSQIISEDSKQYEAIKKRKEREVDGLPLATQVQKSKKLLTGYTWKELIRYLKESPQSSNLMNQCSTPFASKNIDWILNYARKLKPCVQIPFLTVILQDTPLFPRNRIAQQRTQTIKAIDPSGIIELSVSADFIMLYSAHLVTGTALALKKTGLFPCRSGEVVLNVVKENVIYIASSVKLNDNDSGRKLTDSSDNKSDKVVHNIVSKRNGVTIIQVCKIDFSFDDLLQDYKKLTDPKLYAEQLEGDKRESQFGESDFNSSSASLFNDDPSGSNSTRINQPQLTKTISSSSSFLNNENTSDSHPGVSFEDDEDGDELFKNINLDTVLCEQSFSNNTASNQSQIKNETQFVSLENSQPASNDNYNNYYSNSSDLNMTANKEENCEPFGFDDDSFDEEMLLLEMPGENEEEKQPNKSQNLDVHSMLNNKKVLEQQQKPQVNEVEISFNEHKEQEKELEEIEEKNPFDESEEEQELEVNEEENPFSEEEMDLEYENAENVNDSNQKSNQSSTNNYDDDDDPEDFFDNFDAELQMM